MNSQNETCGIIEDLIPLYAENLCSDESRAAVEAHLQHCERCRKLADALPAAPSVPEEAVPDEAKTFRKVNRFMTKNRRLNLVLILLLALILLGLGLLTVGQIDKSLGVPSFESIVDRFRIRRLVRMIAEGDAEGFLPQLTCDNYTGFSSLSQTSSAYADTAKKYSALLPDAYQAAYGGEKVQHIKLETEYVPFILSSENGAMGNDQVRSEAVVTFQSGKTMTVDLSKSALDGKFDIHVTDDQAESDMMSFLLQGTGNDYCNLINLIANPSFERLPGMLVNRMAKEAATEEAEKLHCAYIANCFDTESRAAILERIRSFRESYTVTNCILSQMHYDTETKTIFWDLTLEAEDGSGKALLETRFTRVLSGLSPQDPSQNKVYPDGCSEALADDLRNLF